MKNCKKLLAFILSMLLVFTMALNPVITVSAISEKAEVVEVEAEEPVNFFDSVINWIVDGVHNIVGGFLSIFGEECPFCDKVHGKESEDKSAADEYFENNAQLIDTIEVGKSKDVLTESEVKSFLADKGFDGYPITYAHSINGDHVDETEVLADSEEKHPMYQTIYVSANEESWVIYVINGEIFANPIDFNLESDLGVELLISESEMLTSYDDETNKFYITIPFDSACLTISVDKIDAETLDELTVEKICDLSGATISTSENVYNDTLDIDSISTYSFEENFTSFSVDTTDNVSVDDPFIVVSLGDSYSSGEGIEPFYGQDKSLSEKVKDQDWLAHRSKKSWPSLLKVPGVTGSTTMSEFRVATGSTSSADIQWYFGAVSGAETKHFNENKQKKKYLQHYSDGITLNRYPISGEVYLPKQLEIFNNITGDVDYVTLTVGGNDVGFSDIVTTCVTNCAYLYVGGSSKLEDTFSDLWTEFDTTKANIKKVYEDISDAAGPQATIIVAGYPKLLDKNGKGAVINKAEATLVNRNVSAFNDEIEKIVKECSSLGMDIHFVDVETEFDKDGGHQAYSSNAWINKVKFGSRAQDIKDNEVASAYSIHPNEEGAKAYARCVNAKIEEIEVEKHKGILAGKICKASDRTSPITEARVEIVAKDTCIYLRPDSTGNYSQTLVAGEYPVKVTADGYIDFYAYATIEKDLTTYMETFLMVEGEEGETGTAVGKITNAMTGYGVEGVKLDVRSGWNNADKGDILTTITTNSSGDYIVTLPIGNYTLVASKNGFVSNTVNIVVQKDMSSVKNGSITPVISGNKFRVVLTWSEHPEDLDSHIEGTCSDGYPFHVFFGDQSQYDGSVEVANLDVDDTTSYGPETITLNTTTNEPYYYYIHHYSGYETLATSNAQVKLYQGENLVATFNVPTDQGSEIYWNVFAIKNGELIVKNTITSNPDVTY